MEKKIIAVWNVTFEDGTMPDDNFVRNFTIETEDGEEEYPILKEKVEDFFNEPVKEFSWDILDVNNIFSQIDITWERVGKSSMCSGYEYKVTVFYKGNSEEFTYHTNYHDDKDNRELLYCLISDACAYEDNTDILDFKDEFGYDDNKKCREAYNGCKETYEKLHRLFDDETYDVLYDEIMVGSY